MGESKRRKLLDPEYGKGKKLVFYLFAAVKDMPDLINQIKTVPSISQVEWFSFVAFTYGEEHEKNSGFVLYTKDLKKSAIIYFAPIVGISESDILAQAQEYRRGIIKESISKKTGFPINQIIFG